MSSLAQRCGDAHPRCHLRASFVFVALQSGSQHLHGPLATQHQKCSLRTVTDAAIFRAQKQSQDICRLIVFASRQKLRGTQAQIIVIALHRALQRRRYPRITLGGKALDDADAQIGILALQGQQQRL